MHPICLFASIIILFTATFCIDIISPTRQNPERNKKSYWKELTYKWRLLDSILHAQEWEDLSVLRKYSHLNNVTKNDFSSHQLPELSVPLFLQIKQGQPVNKPVLWCTTSVAIKEECPWSLCCGCWAGSFGELWSLPRFDTACHLWNSSF